MLAAKFVKNKGLSYVCRPYPYGVSTKLGTQISAEYCIVDHEAALNVTKADIVDKIASETGLTKLETKAVVDGFLLSIIDALAEGNRIELRGFGVFSVKSRKPRMARNPRTGDPVPLEERFIPAFKVSSEFQEKVHGKLRADSPSTPNT